MTRFAALSVLALLAACAAQPEVARFAETTHSVATALDNLPDGPACEIGPDGGAGVGHSSRAGPVAARPGSAGEMIDDPVPVAREISEKYIQGIIH